MMNNTNLSHRRYVPISSAEMQRRVLNLVESGDMEPITLENGITAYRLTPKGLEAAQPVKWEEYRLTDLGRAALDEMKRWH
jgi:predicted transcriptional regulator